MCSESVLKALSPPLVFFVSDFLSEFLGTL